MVQFILCFHCDFAENILSQQTVDKMESLIHGCLHYGRGHFLRRWRLLSHWSISVTCCCLIGPLSASLGKTRAHLVISSGSVPSCVSNYITFPQQTWD